VIIVTDHSAHDFSQIVKHARLVINACNATRKIDELRDRIVMA